MVTRRMLLRSGGFLIAGTALTPAKLALAQWVVTDPGLTAQQIWANAQNIFNEVQSLATQANQYLTEANSYVLQVEQFENMVQNTINLPAGIMGQIQGVINHSMGVLNNIAGAYQRAEGIALSLGNIDKQFKLRFPGYTLPTTPIVGSTGFNPNLYDQTYHSRANGTLDSIQGAMSASSKAVQDLQNELAAEAALQNMSANNVGGTVQAVQAVQQISLHQVTQFDTLNGLVAAQTQAMGNYFAASVQTNQDSMAAEGQFAVPVADSW